MAYDLSLLLRVLPFSNLLKNSNTSKFQFDQDEKKTS